MTNGFCRVCTRKCEWSQHRNLDYTWELQGYKEKQTNAELKARYVDASSKVSHFNQIMDGIQQEFKETEEEVVAMMFAIQTMVAELTEVALSPNVYHSDEYFELMMEQERTERKIGWEARVKMIQNLRGKSKFMSAVGSGDFDPFEEKLLEILESALGESVTTVSSRIEVMKRERKKRSSAKVVMMRPKPSFLNGRRDSLEWEQTYEYAYCMDLKI